MLSHERILLIDVNYRKGSTGKLVHVLADGWKEAGADAFVCYGRGRKIKDDYSYKFGIDIETGFHALLTRLTGLTGSFSLLSTVRLILKIKKYKPSLIHIHELHAYFVNVVQLLRFIKTLNIPVVWTFHCEFMYTGKCGNSYECEKWMSSCGPCPYLHDYPKSLYFDFTRWMQSRKKRILTDFPLLTLVSPSNWLANRIGESFLKRHPRVVIHNGIDVNVFYPRFDKNLKTTLGLDESTRIILTVVPSIEDSNKGIAHFLQLAHEFQNRNVLFIIVGAKETNLTLSQNVAILKRTNNQSELAGLYSMADVFVICSKIENLPTVCLESLCCGTPVCGFDVGGTKETANPPYGIFVNYGDISKLSYAVSVMLDRVNPIFKQGCAAWGRERYGKEAMLNAYRHLYENISAMGGKTK